MLHLLVVIITLLRDFIKFITLLQLLFYNWNRIWLIFSKLNLTKLWVCQEKIMIPLQAEVSCSMFSHMAKMLFEDKSSLIILWICNASSSKLIYTKSTSNFMKLTLIYHWWINQSNFWPESNNSSFCTD